MPRKCSATQLHSLRTHCKSQGIPKNNELYFSLEAYRVLCSLSTQKDLMSTENQNLGPTEVEMLIHASHDMGLHLTSLTYLNMVTSLTYLNIRPKQTSPTCTKSACEGKGLARTPVREDEF